MKSLRSRYLPLIKSLQTSLLLLTGVAGYLSFPDSQTNWAVLFSLSSSLFLAISGSTILNMWYDRDIDAKMRRTCNRPLSRGKLSPGEVLRLGIVFSILGVSCALWLDVLFGLVVFAGLFFDVLVYTVWLKRRTCWSIIWGGVAGGMPVLAGRSLAGGQIDGIGLLLALAVLFWIPIHILTFNIRYHEEYAIAGLPTFPSTYGFSFTRKVIALASILATLAMGAATLWIGLTAGAMRLLVVLGAGLFFLAVTTCLRPTDRLNFGLFKYASLYMLSAMLLIALSGI